jgi:hypothetical protein
VGVEVLAREGRGPQLDAEGLAQLGGGAGDPQAAGAAVGVGDPEAEAGQPLPDGPQLVQGGAVLILDLDRAEVAPHGEIPLGLGGRVECRRRAGVAAQIDADAQLGAGGESL